MPGQDSAPAGPATIDGFTAYAPDLAREAPGYDPQHYRTLAEFEAASFWFRARNDLILGALRAHFPGARDYLEIGCGTGFVLSAVAAAFPGMRTSGSEIFVEGLSVAASRASSSTLFQMDARAIPFRSAFDVIGAFDVLEHIEDDTGVLAELHRALRPGGGLVITVPQHPWLWSEADEIAHHVRRYRAGELEGKLRDAGFDVTWTSSFVSLLLPALAASRLARRKPEGTTMDPFAEFRMPRWLNSAFLAVMRAEAGLMRAGMRFPAGGSRLVVAHRKDA